MMLDTTELGELALQLIDQLADSHQDDEEVSIGVMSIVVEINGTYEGQGSTWVEYRCSDPRVWIQNGLFAAAQRATLNRGQPEE
jgi:hypothetical protein